MLRPLTSFQDTIPTQRRAYHSIIDSVGFLRFTFGQGWRRTTGSCARNCNHHFDTRFNVGKRPSMSGLDVIFTMTVALLAFWGYRAGALGAAVWVVAAYATIVLGAQIVGRIIPLLGINENFASIATSFGYVIFSAIVFTVARWAYSSVRSVINITWLKWVNDVGGGVIGAVLGVAVVGAMIVVAAVLTYVVPEGAVEYGGSSYAASYSQAYVDSAPRSWLDHQLTHSLYVDVLSNIRPALTPFAPREVGIAVDVLFGRIE